jgi:hypothetical protein
MRTNDTGGFPTIPALANRRVSRGEPLGTSGLIGNMLPRQNGFASGRNIAAEIFIAKVPFGAIVFEAQSAGSACVKRQS